jgi:hypothetical protein
MDASMHGVRGQVDGRRIRRLHIPMARAESEMQTSERNQPKQNAWNKGESELVLVQLERLLASHHFKLSKKYPILLRYLVEKTLGGESHLLKERTIGVEVFDRTPDYNTAEDPVVRTTVAEIRKRIAQYYHEDTHNSELRIELTAGSYIPEFHFSTPLQLPPHANSGITEATPQSEAVSAASDSELPTAAKQRQALGPWIALGFFLLVLVSFGAWKAWQWYTISPVETVWAPFIGSHSPVLICIGRPGSTTSEDTHDTTLLDHINQVNALTYDDVMALLDVTDIMRAHAQSFLVKSSAKTTFSDLQEGSTIYVGALDNTWTLRAMKSLRYQFDEVSSGKIQITDHRDHKQNDWIVDQNGVYPNLNRDYAIIARFQNPETDKTVMLVGGIGGDGTKAAAKFLARPGDLKDIANKLQHNRNLKNFEIVLGTQLINGSPGPPRVLAIEIW